MFGGGLGGGFGGGRGGGLGIISACQAIRGGVGQPYGDLPGHQPYNTAQNYYYYRPYNSVHYRDQQDCSSSLGLGSNYQPYTGDAFERSYEETLQEVPRGDKQYLEYSSQGGETWYGGHSRVESVQPEQPVETFFPNQEPGDVQWESSTVQLPIEPSLPVENNVEITPLEYDSRPSLPSQESLELNSVEVVPADSIPDEPVDPATIKRLSDPAKDHNAIDSLIDQLLPLEKGDVPPPTSAPVN